MGNEQLQFIFSLFSLIGLIGILFYLILDKAKLDKYIEKVDELEDEIVTLKDYIDHLGQDKVEKVEINTENTKEKIIELYEQGEDILSIEKHLNIPRATIEMVLKFHNMNKTDNWRTSVD